MQPVLASGRRPLVALAHSVRHGNAKVKKNKWNSPSDSYSLLQSGEVSAEGFAVKTPRCV